MPPAVAHGAPRCSRRRMVLGCQLPPRGAGIERLFSSAAMPGSVTTPPARSSASSGAIRSARALALLDRRGTHHVVGAEPVAAEPAILTPLALAAAGRVAGCPCALTARGETLGKRPTRSTGFAAALARRGETLGKRHRLCRQGGTRRGLSRLPYRGEREITRQVDLAFCFVELDQQGHDPPFEPRVVHADVTNQKLQHLAHVFGCQAPPRSHGSYEVGLHRCNRCNGPGYSLARRQPARPAPWR